MLAKNIFYLFAFIVAGIVCEACDFNSATKWAYWVTNGQNLSYWDNRIQMATERVDPIENPHPFAQETRFDLNAQVIGGPEDWSFVMLEIGNPRLCPQNCSPSLFGIKPYSNCSAVLISYDVYNDYVEAFVNCMHDDSSVCTIEYDQISPNGIEIVYDYGYNATWEEDVFYGEGGGTTSSGSYLYVQETIAEEFVAPLELFYDKEGNLQTSYDTPLIYTVVN